VEALHAENNARRNGGGQAIDRLGTSYDMAYKGGEIFANDWSKLDSNFECP